MSKTSQHKRPTISLCLIAKNEAKNLPRLLDSVEGCFDEIVLVDTGSTDKTVEVAFERGCKVSHFTWVDNFSKARDFAFQQATSDFIMWMDCDDMLHGRENFIKWRDAAMEHADCWLNSYHYAVDKTKEGFPPIVEFVRERVVKRALNPKWIYPIHEGINLPPNSTKNWATSWNVKHMRDEEDMIADKSRNIRIMEKLRDEGLLCPRMHFYYGKELYENGRPTDSIAQFEEALKRELETHDRILAIQHGGYACLGAFDSLKDDPQYLDQKKKFLEKAQWFAHEGMKVDANRAEFYIIAADAHLRSGNPPAAAPYFAAAKGCLKNFDTPFASPVYSFRHLYGEAPSVFLAKIYAQLGLLDKAKAEAKECFDKFGNEEAKAVFEELDKIALFDSPGFEKEKTTDIVFTCPPSNAYPFDEELFKTKPMGGSETALIQMARHLRLKTGRRVLVFNPREEKLIAGSGVEYLPQKDVNRYFSTTEPAIHIAWRHNIKLTNAPTYLWAHDLQTPSVETVQNFDKMLCLSEFSANYYQGLQGVPKEKIIVTRNGVDEDKLPFVRASKRDNKFVWMSSPDRGLEQCMLVMDLVKREVPDAELHVYYGTENLYKFGLKDLADKLHLMMGQRPWVKYHGFTEQKQMYKQVKDAVIWPHCCSFIETFCITALEMLAMGIYPVTRKLGALQDTLRDAEHRGDAVLLDHGASNEAEIKAYADEIVKVWKERRWTKMAQFDFNKHSWSSIADEWMEFMSLKTESLEQAQ